MAGVRALGIIPARRGSKGVPNKNLRLLGGRPLLAHTIEAARASRLDRVVASTEDEEIASVARAYGAEVPFIRPRELASDTATSLAVVLHGLTALAAADGYRPDIVALLQPTSPFRTPAHIDAGLEALETRSVISAVGVRQVDAEHPYFMLVQDGDGRWREFDPRPHKPLRRQDVPPCYVINDALFLSRSSHFDGLAPHAAVIDFNSIVGVVMDRESSIDINEELDFALAEAVLARRRA